MKFRTTCLSQLQPMRKEEKDDMQKTRKDKVEEGKTAVSIFDFMGLAGIGPKLAEFVTEFIEKPETFLSMSFEKRCEIENQMDAILSSFGQRLAMHSNILDRAGRNPCRVDD
jgi:hypothetical protein